MPLSSTLVVDLSPSHDEDLSRSERSALTAALLAEASTTSDATRAAELRSRVVMVNRGVAEAVARRYRNRGIPLDDLTQVGYEGLTKAVARFDPSRRHDLLTFAVPTIRGELQRYFRDLGWTVRPPRRLQELQARAHSSAQDLEQDLGRAPRETEVASALGVPLEEYREAMAVVGCFQPASLDLPVGDDETATLGELLLGEHRSLDASDARIVLAPAVRGLSDRDRRILRLRFYDDCTQAEIGADLGVTQMQVSRLLSRILAELHTTLTASR